MCIRKLLKFKKWVSDFCRVFLQTRSKMNSNTFFSLTKPIENVTNDNMDCCELQKWGTEPDSIK